MALVLAAALAAAACDPRRGVAPTPARTPLPTPPAAVADDLPVFRSSAAAGARAFAEHCTPCHGDGGDGRGPAAAALSPAPTDFRDEAYMWDQAPAWYYQAVTRGVAGSAMGRWDHRLDEAARWDTAFYAWSLADTADEINAGRRVYDGRCAGCHASDGNGVGAARFADPRRVRRSRADVAGALRAAHPHLAEGLGEMALRHVVGYLWTFLYDPAAPDGP